MVTPTVIVVAALAEKVFRQQRGLQLSFSSLAAVNYFHTNLSRAAQRGENSIKIESA